ncbi:MAG: Lpg1974 family pore-forming outer membrane protein [Gemmataceae bacterium]|nr:Lpg1974 family pore-forming outer membrane protein [Gemmataceae bacterium]
MTRCLYLILIAATLASVCSEPAAAQTPSAAFLAPIDDPGAINSAGLFAADGVAPGTPAWGSIKADLDFLFLQPLFPSRSVRLLVPSPAGGSVLGDTSDLSNDLSFSPGFEIGYQFKNTGFGVQVTGRILHLTGRLERTVNDTQGGAIAQATASSTIDLAVVNPIEGFLNIPLSDWCELRHPYLRESLFVLTLGGRYAHLQQNYSSTVVTGPGFQGSLVAKQNFDGFGITGAWTGIFPVAERWALYSHVRGSVLFGENDRESSITIVAPGASSGTTARELKTDVFPMGELELGVIYGVPLNRPGPAPNLAPLLWVKTGFVAQAWGDLGLLRINEVNGHQFSDSSLVLLGFSVQIGLDY